MKLQILFVSVCLGTAIFGGKLALAETDTAVTPSNDGQNTVQGTEDRTPAHVSEQAQPDDQNVADDSNVDTKESRRNGPARANHY